MTTSSTERWLDTNYIQNSKPKADVMPFRTGIIHKYCRQTSGLSWLVGLCTKRLYLVHRLHICNNEKAIEVWLILAVFKALLHWSTSLWCSKHVMLIYIIKENAAKWKCALLVLMVIICRACRFTLRLLKVFSSSAFNDAISTVVYVRTFSMF